VGGTDGIYVATQCGIIASSGRPYFIPRDGFVVQNSAVPIHAKLLDEIRNQILAGEYNIWP
jgi:hypothetical protein